MIIYLHAGSGLRFTYAPPAHNAGESCVSLRGNAELAVGCCHHSKSLQSDAFTITPFFFKDIAPPLSSVLIPI